MAAMRFSPDVSCRKDRPMREMRIDLRQPGFAASDYLVHTEFGKEHE